MVEQLMNSLLFYFFSAEFRCREKVRDPPNYPRSVICWDLFLSFFFFFGGGGGGGTLVLQMGDIVGPRYIPRRKYPRSVICLELFLY